jgi:hypothetical protein
VDGLPLPLMGCLLFARVKQIKKLKVLLVSTTTVVRDGWIYNPAGAFGLRSTSLVHRRPTVDHMASTVRHVPHCSVDRHVPKKPQSHDLLKVDVLAATRYERYLPAGRPPFLGNLATCEPCGPCRIIANQQPRSGHHHGRLSPHFLRSDPFYHSTDQT